MGTDRRAILVDAVSKQFRLPHEHVHTLKERALHPFRKPQFDALPALRDVSFDVQRGEFFGIVGRNGSGKSTLLKCLAGIYRVDHGSIYVDGRMSAFIELGVGFNPDLAARDNVMINATMLGLSPKESRRRFDRILDFAELHDFVDLKLKNYSSGMMVRLAFSVAIQVDADILLIDEVLAVGDASFQQKCFDEFARIRRSDTTVLLVTHDMGAVERFCDRAMVLEHGRLVDIGDTERIGTRYLELNFSSEARAAEVEAAHASEQPACDQEESEQKAEVQADGPALAVAACDDGAGPQEAPVQAQLPEPEKTRFGNGKAELVDAWFEDANGSRTEVLRGGERCAFCARVTFHEQVDNPLVGVSIYNAIDDHVLGFNNRHLAPAGTFAPGEVLIFRFAFHNALVPGRYHLSPAVAHDGGGVHWLDYRKRWRSVVVTGTGGTTGALVELPLELSLQRMSSAREPHLRSA
ncbi:MAG: type transport system ATP-binding protein [Solirubrobacteraceae bacterium]|nr:type transport system ATP-binding protein [Solirubrobacteraceae bacterium]